MRSAYPASWRTVVPSLAIVVILAGCDGGAGITTTSGPGEPGTSQGTTTTTEAGTTSAPAPSTTPPTTAGTVEVPLAKPDDPELRVLFSLPAGPGGVTFGGGFEDWALTGPQALTVAPDGSIWIADTNARRLLHLARDGATLADVDTNAADVGGLIDLAAVEDGVWGLEVVPALDRHRIVLFDESGEVVERHELPSGLHLGDGLWGLATGSDGRLWIELEAGAQVYAAFDPAGAFAPQPVEGYEIQGTTVGPVPGVAGGMARFRVGDVTIEAPVREQGGFAFEGDVPGWVAVLLSDVVFDASGVIRVDVTIQYVDLTGDIVATGSYPLDQVASDGYVPQDFIAIAPDGRPIAMKPGPEGLDIVELALFPASGD